jgi:hypothetical protein
MPFKKVGENDYTSPTGRHFNQAQVRLYYANGGHFPGEKHAAGGPIKGKEQSMARAKSYGTFGAAYAAGGPVLGRTRDFLKEPVEFREKDEGNRQNADVVGDLSDADQKYGKDGAGKGTGMVAPPKCGPNKSLKAVKPRR